MNVATRLAGRSRHSFRGLHGEILEDRRLLTIDLEMSELESP